MQNSLINSFQIRWHIFTASNNYFFAPNGFAKCSKQNIFFIAFIILCSCNGVASAQNQKLKISGAVSGSAIGYGVSGIAARRAPLYWLLSGNLTLTYWKITAPISANFSEQDQTLRYPQPFNQFGISPKYKDVTFHLGYRSLNFSEFTLAGTTFLGGGVEYAPVDRFVKVAAMYGRLAKARLVGSLNDLEFGIPSYERWGYGAKVTLGKNGQEVDLIFFGGRDSPSSIPSLFAQNMKITPAENFVTGLNLRRTIGRIAVNAEYALSAYTKDLRDPKVKLDQYQYANYLGSLFTPTISSQFNGAFQGQLNYQANLFNINFKYRRLGPDYKTMGSPFMNNDFEDITGGISTALFNNRLNISGNAGVQRNNLTHNQETQVKRFVGSTTASITISEKLSLSLSYSNFNSSTKLDRFYQQSQIDRIDTLLFLQVTNSLNASFQYQRKKEKLSQSIFFSSSYQVATDKTAKKSEFYNANVGYQLTNSLNNFSINVNVNANSNRVTQENTSIGPTTSIAQQFFQKKIKTAISSSYIKSYQSSVLLNDNIVCRATCTYTTKSKHAFGLDLSLLKSISDVSTTPGFTEFRGGLTYNYSFSKDLWQTK